MSKTRLLQHVSGSKKVNRSLQKPSKELEILQKFQLVDTVQEVQAGWRYARAHREGRKKPDGRPLQKEYPHFKALADYLVGQIASHEVYKDLKGVAIFYFLAVFSENLDSTWKKNSGWVLRPDRVAHPQCIADFERWIDDEAKDGVYFWEIPWTKQDTEDFLNPPKVDDTKKENFTPADPAERVDLDKAFS